MPTYDNKIYTVRVHCTSWSTLFTLKRVLLIGFHINLMFYMQLNRMIDLGPDMDIVAGTAGTPAEPYDSMWGTKKLTAECSDSKIVPLNVRLPLNKTLAHIMRLSCHMRLPRNIKLLLIYLPHIISLNLLEYVCFKLLL